MALSVVQTLSVQQVYTGSFAANVTAGNSVIIALSAFTTSTATISSSAPVFNGASVTGGTLLVHAQSTTSGTNQVYGAIWLLPNLAGGAKSIGVTVTNGGTATAIGFTAWEVSGLGATPSVDQIISGNAASGTTLSSGTTGAISGNPEFIAAVAVSFGNAITKVGAPWTEVNSAGGTDTVEGEQIVTSSGGTFSYAPVAAGSAGWASMIATIQGTSSAGVAVPAPRQTQQARRPGPVRARVGRAVVAAGIIGAAHVPGTPARPFPVSHPQPARAHVGGQSRNAGGNAGRFNRIPVPAPRQLPPVPRLKPQRAIARGNAVLYSRAAASLPHAPPNRRPVPPARATGHGIAGSPPAAVTGVAVPAPLWRPQPKPRPLQRAVVRSVTALYMRAAAPPPPVQPQIRHPAPQRAIWRGVSGPQPRPGPFPQRFTSPRPRGPQRAIWRTVTGSHAQAAPAAAVRQVIQPRPRPVLRALWRGITGQPPPVVPGVAVPAPRLLRQPPRRPPYARVLWRAVYGTPHAGGAPLSDEMLGGVITFQPYGGSVAFRPYAGNITFTPYAGSIVFQPHGGSLTGGAVATQQDISGPNAVIVNNDSYFFLALTYNGAPLNLTGYTLRAVLKATRGTPDSEGLSYAIGTGLTVTNVAGGLVTWVVPHSAITTATGQWYRVDVIDASSEVFTSLFGNFVVLPA